MLIIIDAYNVLKQILMHKIITNNERLDFIAKIRKYSSVKNHSMIIVFDSEPFDYRYEKNSGAVSVIYSGYKITADEYIKDFIEKNINKQMLIVSSDRDLVNFASSHAIPSIDARAFYEIVKNNKSVYNIAVKKSSGVAQKLHSQEIDQQLDELMQMGSQTVMYKDENESVLNKNKPSSKVLSKKDKKLLNILKKL